MKAVDEIGIDELFERGIRLPENRLSFKVVDFEEHRLKYKNVGGVYTFTHGDEGWLYVGISADVMTRIRSHINYYSDGNTLLQRKLAKLSDITVTVYRESNESLREFYENYLVLRNDPICNKAKKSKTKEGYSISSSSYTDEEKEMVIRLYVEGATRKSILDTTGISQQEQNKILRENGIELSRNAKNLYGEEKLQLNRRIVELHKEGLTAQKISTKLNTSKNLVWSGIREYYRKTGEKTPSERRSERNKLILKKYMEDGKSTLQISQEMGINKRTVEGVVYKSKEKIKRNVLTRKKTQERNDKIILHVEKGMDRKEIAEIFNITETYVNTLIHQCSDKDRLERIEQQILRDNEIIRLYLSGGLSHRNIGRETGTSASTVSRVIKTWEVSQ